MDLEILEALALGDRAGALAQLLPGSEDHDYYRCLHAQHAGTLDEADAILTRGSSGTAPRRGSRHFASASCCTGSAMARGPAADEIRDRFGVSHWHEAEVAETDPTRPTRLAAFDGAQLLREGAAHSADPAQVTDEGLYELLDQPLDRARRAALLARITHTPHPALAQLVASILAENRTQFGSLRAHGELTLEQLRHVESARKTMPMHREWVHAVVRRLQPPSAVDLASDLPAREDYLVGSGRS